MKKRSRDTVLQQFLNEPANSKTRERMFFNRLYFDVKMAAARRGYPLSVFEPEVDRDGFDVIFDDGESTRHCQLKSATKSSGTAQWYTSRRFIRPDLNQAGSMYFEASPEGIGLSGAVIVIAIDDSRDPCGIEYLYCDLFLLESLACGILMDSRSVRKRKMTLRDRAKKVVAELHQPGASKALRLPKSLLVKARSADCLLSLMQLHSIEQGRMAWALNVAAAISGQFSVDELGNPKPNVETKTVSHAHAAAKMLLSLIDEPRLRRFESPIRDYPGPAGSASPEH